MLFYNSNAFILRKLWRLRSPLLGPARLRRIWGELHLMSEQQLQQFFAEQLREVQQHSLDVADFTKNHQLPLARIKKVSQHKGLFPTLIL